MEKYTVLVQEKCCTLRLFRLFAELDHADILDEVKTLIEEDITHFVLDLSELSLIDSVGLSLIISILTLSRNAGGDTVLVEPSPKVTQMLIITRLKGLFSVFPTIAAAQQSFTHIV